MLHCIPHSRQEMLMWTDDAGFVNDVYAFVRRSPIAHRAYIDHMTFEKDSVITARTYKKLLSGPFVDCSLQSLKQGGSTNRGNYSLQVPFCGNLGSIFYIGVTY